MRVKAFILVAIVLLVGTVSAAGFGNGVLTVRAININDGFVDHTTVGSFTEVRNGVGQTSSSSIGGGTSNVLLQANATGDNTYNHLRRWYWSGDTSGLPDNAVIDSAIFSVWGYTTIPGTGLGSTALELVGAGDTGTLETGDYGALTNVVYANNISSAAFRYGTGTANPNNFTANAAFIANISKTGNTSVALTTSWDVYNDTTGLTWSGGANTNFVFWDTYAASANTTLVPYLQISYHVPNNEIITVPNTATAPLPNGGETFGCLLRDKNLSVVTNASGAYMYTIHAYAKPETTDMRMFNMNTLSLGSAVTVLPNGTDSGTWHSTHYALKAADDLYILFYTSDYVSSGATGIRVATSTTPDGTFTPVDNATFEVTAAATGWEAGGTLEQDVGAVKITDNATYLEYWMLYSSLNTGASYEGWYRVAINKGTKAITLIGRHPGNPIALYNSISNRAGGATPFTVNGEYIMATLIKADNATNYVGALYSNDPLFQTVSSYKLLGGMATFSNLTHPNDDEQWGEKFDMFLNGTTLYILSESTVQGTTSTRYIVGLRSYDMSGLLPVASFTASVSGSTVAFTDTSTNSPLSRIWKYNQHEAPGWTTFSTAANPSYNFVTGTYDINLTVTNAAGSDSEEKNAFIVVSAAGEGTTFPSEPTGYEEAKARYATDNEGLITAMVLVFLVAAIVGVAIALKCIREGITETTFPLIAAYFIGIFILVIIFATLPAIVHVGEVV